MSTLERPLIGCTEPRIGTPASGDDYRVREILQFSEDIGVHLLPWQSELFSRSLRMTGDKWTHRTVLAITSRQSGKSRASSVRALAELVLWDARLVVTAAQSRDVALFSWRLTCELAEEAGMDIRNIRHATGSEELILDVGGRPASLKVVSSTSEGARGLSPQLVILDEVASLKSLEPYAALEKSRRAQPNSQCWAITTEGTHESVVLDALQGQGRAAALANSAAGIGYYEWSGDESLAPDDRRGWASANPALGFLIDESTIAEEYRTDPPEVFRREILCQRTAVHRTWLPATTWDACADSRVGVPDDATGLVFGIDATPDLQHAAIAVGWPTPDDRVHVEAIATFTGTTASVDAQRRLEALVGRWKPRALLAVAKGPVEGVAARVAGAAQVELVNVGPSDLDRAARSLFEGVVSRRVVHPPDAVLAGAVGAVEGDGGLIRLGRSAGNITPAVAAVLAAWGVERQPVAVAPTWVAW